MTGRVLLAALLAGWLADQLARPDRDVEAGIEAYEAGELDAALEHFEAAIARHGDRPELSLNRGLVLLAQGEADAARRAFERASESDDPEIRSSAFYERGNVAFDAEDWDVAIESYIECLKARPDHANAKWNLELARKLEQEQEKEDEKDDEKDDEQDETGGEDSGSSTGDDSGSTGDDSGGSTGDDSGGSSGDDSGGSSGDDSGGSSGGDSGGSGGSGEPPPEDGKQDQPKDDQPPPDAKPPPPPPPPLDQMDLQKALEDLDEQDRFLLDRPAGGVRPPTEDW
jgi:Ca-activated chloride channel family protein